MYACALENAGKTLRFTITGAGANGWEVKEERDSHVIRSQVYTDWHRVERARMWFAREVQNLQMAGWTRTAA